MSLEFNNPKEINDEEFANIIGLDFNSSKDNKKQEEVINDDEGTKEGEEEAPVLDLGLEKEKPGIKSNTGETETGNVYVDLINQLAENIGFNEIFEGFDPEGDPDQNTVLKFIEHNTSKKIDEALVEFFDNLTPFSKRIISYDLNAKGEDIESYLKTLVEETNIKSLSVDNEFDQEKIIRYWYENDKNFTKEEIEEKIEDLKSSSLLEKEAKRLKPKLDSIAEKLAKEKEESQKQVREIEKRYSEDYTNRVIETLKDGKVAGIKLTKEEVAEIYSYLTDEKMEVPVLGGKKAQMSPLEAVIFYNKYNKNGSVENLALATLLLTNREKFDKVYTNRATTEVTKDFVKSVKWSDSLKVASEEKKEKINQTKTQTQNTPKYNWVLNVKN